MPPDLQQQAITLLYNLLFEYTFKMEIPGLLIDQMIWMPGIGKFLPAKALAELLSKKKLKYILVYTNMEDLNNPKIRESSSVRVEKL